MPGRRTKVPRENKIETPCSICEGLIYLRNKVCPQGHPVSTEASEKLLEMQDKRKIRKVGRVLDGVTR
jgi:hypothetical protein